MQLAEVLAHYKNEISITSGHIYKQSPIIAKSGKNDFSFFSQGKFAWISDGEEEFNLIKVMKKASKLSVSASDLKGNKTVYYALSSNEKKYVPNFLIEKDIEVSDLGTLLNGLKIVGDYLDKTILKPNDLNYPNSRLLFLNTLR